MSARSLKEIGQVPSGDGVDRYFAPNISHALSDKLLSPNMYECFMNAMSVYLFEKNVAQI